MEFPSKCPGRLNRSIVISLFTHVKVPLEIAGLLNLNVVFFSNESTCVDCFLTPTMYMRMKHTHTYIWAHTHTHILNLKNETADTFKSYLDRGIS